MRAQPEASHYIGGAYLDDASGAALQSIYPATGEVIAKLNAATPAVVEKAIAAASEGFRVWREMPPAARGRVLRRAAGIMRTRNRELSELETLDTGKPISETLVADAASGADCLEYFGGIAATISGHHFDLPGAHAYTRREPLGIVCGIGAWNYPIQIASWKAAPALACGNAMIFKPSEMTPLSALKLAEVLTEAGLPPGVFNVVQGAADVGAALVSHAAIGKVSVTGSVATGEKIAASAGIKPVTMELGGKSPIVVFEDANLDDAVAGVMMGNFYSSGQVCSNGTRVFVHRSIREQFVEQLVARTANLRIGDPLDEATQTGPLISIAHRDRVAGFIARGRRAGAVLVCGGDGPVAHCDGRGAFLAPTVFTGVTDDMELAREEIFGPVCSILDFDNEAEVVARANATPYGLAAGIFTRDLARAHRVAARIDAGICWVNSYNLTPVEIPFGGSKRSGFGRENGQAAIEHYTKLKTVYVGLGPVETGY
jgi:betaine-aldehyde dehydrogenase